MPPVHEWTSWGTEVVVMANTNAQADAAIFGTFVHIAGTGYQTNGAASSGATEVTIDTGTTSLSKGQTGKFTGHDTLYTIVSIDAATSRDTSDITGKGIHGVEVTQITISPALTTGVSNNVAFTPTASSAQRLPPYIATDSIVVLADESNSDDVFVGNSGVTTSHGFQLKAGASLEIKCTDASSVYIIGTTNDHVYITGS